MNMRRLITQHQSSKPIRIENKWKHIGETQDITIIFNFNYNIKLLDYYGVINIIENIMRYIYFIKIQYLLNDMHVISCSKKQKQCM